MTVFVALITLLPLILVVALLMLSARTRAGIVFGVSLPVEVANGPEVHAALGRYRMAVLLPGVLTVAACMVAWTTNHTIAGAFTYPIGFACILAAALFARGREASRLRPLHVELPVTRTAQLGEAQPSLRPMWVAVDSLLPLAAAAWWLKTHWQNAPERWPRHWDAAGHVNGWGIRSLPQMMTPLALGAFVVVIFIAIVAFQTLAPGPDMQRRQKLTAPLTAMAWAMSLFFAYEAIAPTIGGATNMMWAIVLHLVVILGIVVWLVIRTGVMSSNTSSPDALPAYDGTSDEFWHAGLFYYNPDDAAVLVPKRFGFGWTFNFARPVAWVFVAVVLLFTAATIVTPLLLHK